MAAYDGNGRSQYPLLPYLNTNLTHTYTHGHTHTRTHAHTHTHNHAHIFAMRSSASVFQFIVQIGTQITANKNTYYAKTSSPSSILTCSELRALHTLSHISVTAPASVCVHTSPSAARLIVTQESAISRKPVFILNAVSVIITIYDHCSSKFSQVRVNEANKHTKDQMDLNSRHKIGRQN